MAWLCAGSELTSARRRHESNTSPADAFEWVPPGFLAAEFLFNAGDNPCQQRLDPLIDRAGVDPAEDFDFLDGEEGVGQLLQPRQEIKVRLGPPTQTLFQAIEPLPEYRARIFKGPVLDGDGVDQDGPLGLLASLARHQAHAFLKRTEPVILPKPGALGKQHNGSLGSGEDAGRRANGLAVSPLAQDAVAADPFDPPAAEPAHLEQVIGHDVKEKLAQCDAECAQHKRVGPAAMVAGEQDAGLPAERFPQQLHPLEMGARHLKLRCKWRGNIR